MLVNISKYQENIDLLPPARAEIGVSGDVAPSPGMIMGRFYIDRATRSRRQYIINADMALFVISGYGSLTTGPPHDSYTDTFEEKDFIFIESGEIFTIENTGDEMCIAIFVLVGVELPEELNRTFIEVPNI